MDGREPEEVTEYEYDEGGRMVRSVTVREPLYTEQDRAELIALAAYRAGLCPLCGRPLDVCTSEEGAPGAPQFAVRQSMCRATREIAELKSALTEEGKKPLRNAEARLFGTTVRGE
jgi:hypothetical protein